MATPQTALPENNFPLDEQPLLSDEEAQPPLTWLERRKWYIGGSDSASMFADPSLPGFGKDGIKYGCARRLIYDKSGQPEDFKRTKGELENFARGHELEAVAAMKFVRENGLGLKIRRHAPHRIHPDYPRAGVNLDYYIVGVTKDQFSNLFPDRDDISGPGVLEVKTANEYVFEDVENKKGAIVDYVYQGQHAMAVKRVKWGIFAVLGFGAGLWRLSWFTMLADERLGERILQRTNEVWAMVEGRAEMPDALPQPDKQGRCVDCQFRKTCLGSAFIAAPDPDGTYIEMEDVKAAVEDYYRVQRLASAYEDQRRAIAATLLPVLEKNGRAVVPSSDLKFGRFYQIEERVDTKALKNEEPEIAERFTRTIPKDYVKVWPGPKRKKQDGEAAAAEEAASVAS